METLTLAFPPRASNLSLMHDAAKPGVRILVVDDDPSILECFKLLLEHDGHTVQTARDGEAALALLAERKFELVFTDFSMPGMHGDKLVARIHELVPGQRIIMATAFAQELKVFGKGHGLVDAYLCKPFSFSELQETIEAVLASDQQALSAASQQVQQNLPNQRAS